MKTFSVRASQLLDLALRALLYIGLGIAVLGAGLDLLPSASPGIDLPQLTVIAAGLVVALLAFGLRRESMRRRLRRNLPAALATVAVTLIALEIALTLGGLPAYYAVDSAQENADRLRWRTCDEAGCRIVRDVAMADCDMESGRRMCMLNPQGFADRQSFVADAARAGGRRVLLLGDSFTFGMSADAGHGFAELLEANDPAGLYWNAAVPGSGTHHALESFKVYAPLLKPAVTVLGFYMNDFENNMISTSDWSVSADPVDATVVTWIDDWGNALQIDQESAFYYRKAGVDPPASQFERTLGATRLGALLLRSLDALARLKQQADGANSLQAEVTRKFLRALRDEAEAHETALLVMLIPQPGDIERPGARYQLARHLLDELGMDYLEPSHSLDARLDYASDGHWNNEGHSQVAMLLSDCLDAFNAEGSLASCAS